MSQIQGRHSAYSLAMKRGVQGKEILAVIGIDIGPVLTAARPWGRQGTLTRQWGPERSGV